MQNYFWSIVCVLLIGAAIILAITARVEIRKPCDCCGRRVFFYRRVPPNINVCLNCYLDERDL